MRTTAESWPRHWPNNHDNADAEYHEAIMGTDIWVVRELIVEMGGEHSKIKEEGGAQVGG